jgi:hypothetical protein
VLGTIAQEYENCVLRGRPQMMSHLEGGRGDPEIVTICDNGEGGVGREIVTSHILI